MFSYSDQVEQLAIARFLMEAAASFFLLGAFLVIRIYFANHLFPLLSGLTLTISFDQSEFLASLIFIGYAIGAPLIALLAQRFGIRWMMMCAALTSVLSTFFLVYFSWPIYLVAILLLLQGVTTGSFVLTAMAIKRLTPEDILASTLSFSTLLAQLIGSLMLMLLSWVIYIWHGESIMHHHNVYSSVILQKTMYLLVIALCFTFIVAYLIKLPHPKK
ncbi:MFS transporter [Legionella oakridgensis]|uniref:MFS transporter n=1 Tax=Legionella oakridgensis TaxID=29423 RepID=UPI0004B77B02|nr:MFS transporter [Legionella oakridgensis]